MSNHVKIRRGLLRWLLAPHPSEIESALETERIEAKKAGRPPPARQISWHP